METVAGKSLVLGLLGRGRLVEARDAAEQLLTRAPEDTDALYAAAMARLVGGDTASALPLLVTAAARLPLDPVIACNLGMAHLRLGDSSAGIPHLQRALALRPEYDLAAYNLACAHIAAGQVEAAQPLLRDLLAKSPGNAEWQCALADTYRLKGDWRRAIKGYQQALAHNPALFSANLNISGLLTHVGEAEQAIEHARRALAASPKDANAHLHLGRALAATEHYEEAMDVLADGHDIDPTHRGLGIAIGRCFMSQGEHHEAGDWFSQVLQQHPDDLDALCGLAKTALEDENAERALQILLPHRERGDNNPEYLLTLADAQWDDGDADGALATLERARELHPQRASVHVRMGNIHSSSGDVPKAIACFEQALADQPNCVPAINGLASAQRGKIDPAIINKAHDLLNKAGIPDGPAATLNFALAFYHDGRKEPEIAARHLREGNRLQWEARSRRGWTYDPADHKRQIDALIATFTKEFFEEHQGIGNPDPMPAFIVGMPRSGTTLTEQILARHSQVLGVGERNYATRAFNAFVHKNANGKLDVATAFRNVTALDLAPFAAEYLRILQKLADKSGKPGVTRVLDKMPDNYSMVGWIALLFPNAKIIHARRDVRDVAMSCFQTQFGAIRWACHPEHIVERIRQYQRIMQHWREVLPGRFFESSYETLTNDQELESRRLVRWLDLPWEDQCLKFYESDRLVRTASITQVRQPIYKTSVAKWKAYEPYLPDLLEPLAALNHKPL